MIEDISMLQRNYHDSLVRLCLITNDEAEQIFGGIQSLLPVHTELKEELTKAKGSNGSVDSVASILLKWVSNLLIMSFNFIAFIVLLGSQTGSLCFPLCQSSASQKCFG